MVRGLILVALVSSTGCVAIPSFAGTGDAAVDGPPDATPCTGWCPEASGTSQDLFGVWGASATDVWAVGVGGIFRRQSGIWTPVPLPAGITPAAPVLRSVWGAAANDVWAVGDAGVTIHFDGAQWTNVIDINDSMRVLNDVGICTWNDCGPPLTGPGPGGGVRSAGAGMTPNETFYLRTFPPATPWTALPGSGIGAPVKSVFQNFAVAGNRVFGHGTTWGVQGIQAELTKQLHAIWGTIVGPEVLLWVAGNDGEIGSVTLSNGTWALEGSGLTSNHLYGLDGTSETDIWAVGDRAILHRNATVWTAEPTPPDAIFRAVRAISATDVWAVGDGGAIYRLTP